MMKRQKFCSVMTIISSFIDFLTTSIFIPFLADFYGEKLKNPQKVPKNIVFKKNVFCKSCLKLKNTKGRSPLFFDLSIFGAKKLKKRKNANSRIMCR